jgi:hypothetical protein
VTRALKRNTLRVKREHFIHFIDAVTSLLHQGFYSPATSSLLSFIVSLIYSWKKETDRGKRFGGEEDGQFNKKNTQFFSVSLSLELSSSSSFKQREKEQSLRLMFLDFLFLVSSSFSVSCVVLIA